MLLLRVPEVQSKDEICGFRGVWVVGLCHAAKGLNLGVISEPLWGDLDGQQVFPKGQVYRKVKLRADIPKAVVSNSRSRLLQWLVFCHLPPTTANPGKRYLSSERCYGSATSQQSLKDRP